MRLSRRALRGAASSGVKSYKNHMAATQPELALRGYRNPATAPIIPRHCDFDTCQGQGSCRNRLDPLDPGSSVWYCP